MRLWSWNGTPIPVFLLLREFPYGAYLCRKFCFSFLLVSARVFFFFGVFSRAKRIMLDLVDLR